MSHRISVLIVLLAAVTCAWAEDPYQVAWTAQVGTSYRDWSGAVGVDASGNVYISGRLGGASVGAEDAFLAKYDASGSLLWSQQIGTVDSDISRAVAVDASGNAYISGGTLGSLGGPNAGDSDAFLTKYDGSGSLLWSQQIGTSSHDASYSVAVDASGNAYISGTTRGSLGGPSAGFFDVFLTKYDASGSLLWSRQIGTPTEDTSVSVAVDASGNAYISGLTTGSLGGTNAGGYDAFLAKYDGSGSLLWSQQIGTADSDTSRAVAVDADGNAYITGETEGSLGGTSAGGQDAFLIKYDASGSLLWSQQIGTSGTDWCSSVAVDASGNAYINGSTPGDLGGPNAGRNDAFLAKYDASGSLLWSQQIGTSGDDYGYSVAVDASGSAYISGGTYGSLGGPNAGGQDAFLVKYVPEPVTVVLDIKPGSDPNSVNLKSKGLLPVVAYGSDQLDVTEIDLDTLLLNGVGARVKPNGSWHVSFEDVDGDLLLDLLMHFEMQALGIEPGMTDLTLTGLLMDGTGLQGADAIRIVPDFNGDLMVNATDLAIMKHSYGTAGVGFDLGDANADGLVDATDLALLRVGLGWSESAFGEPIPEPASAVLFALAGLIATARRRRRKR